MQHQKTITGSLVQMSSRGNSGAAPDPENEQKLGTLLRLGSHYWQPDFTPAQAKHLLADYLEDLATARVADVDVVCREWRRNPENKRFPRCGELLKAITDNRRDSAQPDDKRRPQFPDRPLLWWAKPKSHWRTCWKETDVPMGEMLKDKMGGKLRQPERVAP